MEPTTLYADLLLPLPVGGTFTYRIPVTLHGLVKTGIRVVVQFGAKKIYTALVLRVHEDPPQEHQPKDILSVLDDMPIVNDVQFRFWEWLATYYLCHPGEVMNVALPAAFKLASESKIALSPVLPAEMPALNEKEEMILEALHHRKAIAVSEVARITERQKTIPLIKTMMEKGLVVTEETLRDPYRPKLEHFVTFTKEYEGNEELLRNLFDHLEKRARKQLGIVMTYVTLSGYGTSRVSEVRRSDLLKQSGGTLPQLQALTEKGVFEVSGRIVSRFGTGETGGDPGDIGLTAHQEEALGLVRESLRDKEVVLLHGVTSSGKTELYIKLIHETVSRGQQALFLLPEIALTTQIVQRLQRYFGDRVGVYHSRFNMHERVEIWRSVLAAGEQAPGSRRYDVILGARSAVFLPFSDLGLVIVDEEHDPSFKQMDPAPRYNGRDAAIYLARLHGAKTILGSATPAVETCFNARQGKYGLVELSERYGNIAMPEVQVVDIREQLRQGLMKSHFSSVLIERIATALANGEQAILFQNRRGFSLRLECDLCHWMPSCKNCDVTLVYHKKNNQLRCHYCGYVARIPEKCPDCQGVNIKMKGFGTEKVEEELAILFRDARIARMDLDTTRTRHSLQQIISDFEARKIDILVGTQMVTKGLDFDHVSLVCILNADNMLGYPDFRAAERSYQLMAQVSGRSGRKNKQGQVLIQTYHPGHLIIRDVVNHDYESFFRQQLSERQRYGYPPFTRLILLRLKHRDAGLLDRAADKLAVMLRRIFGKRVLGPEYPPVSRIMTYYIKHIMIKMERGIAIASMKDKLTAEVDRFLTDPGYRQVKVIMDVDPQ